MCFGRWRGTICNGTSILPCRHERRRDTFSLTLKLFHEPPASLDSPPTDKQQCFLVDVQTCLVGELIITNKYVTSIVRYVHKGSGAWSGHDNSRWGRTLWFRRRITQLYRQRVDLPHQAAGKKQHK